MSIRETCKYAVKVGSAGSQNNGKRVDERYTCAMRRRGLGWNEEIRGLYDVGEILGVGVCEENFPAEI